MAEKTDRGRLEDKNPPDVVIVSTLDLRQLPHSTYLSSASSPAFIITSFRVNLEPKWPTTSCILPELGFTVVVRLIFSAAWAANKTGAVQQTRTCLCSIKQSIGWATLSGPLKQPNKFRRLHFSENVFDLFMVSDKQESMRECIYKKKQMTKTKYKKQIIVFCFFKYFSRNDLCLPPISLMWCMTSWGSCSDWDRACRTVW